MSVLEFYLGKSILGFNFSTLLPDLFDWIFHSPPWFETNSRTLSKGLRRRRFSLAYVLRWKYYTGTEFNSRGTGQLCNIRQLKPTGIINRTPIYSKSTVETTPSESDRHSRTKDEHDAKANGKHQHYSALQRGLDGFRLYGVYWIRFISFRS